MNRCLTLLIKLSLFFLKLAFLEIELPGLEGGDDDEDLRKYDFFGVVGGEGNIVGVAGVAGRVGVVTLVGVDGGCLAGCSPLPVPFCCLTSSGLVSFVSFFSSSFFSVRRVLEEVVPVEGFLGLLIGREWVEGVSVCMTGSKAGGFLSTVLASFTGTIKSGAFGLAGVG